MGTYVNGANGAFRGKVGSVVGSSWKGIDYMKGRPNIKRNATPTAAQLEQQKKVAVVGKFIRSIKRVITLGFDSDVPGVSEYNRAMAYVLDYALDITTTPYSIVYSKVLVTSGDLINGDGPAAVAGASGKITFNWQDNSTEGVVDATDTAVLVAYSPTMNLAIFTKNGAIRSAGTATLSAGTFKGQTVETYIAFLKADGSAISRSLYTGQVAIAA
jgi:hypothetical protein